MRATLGRIHTAKTTEEQVHRFRLLGGLLEHYATHWAGTILPFDGRAAQVFQGFEPKLIRRIGPRDARIAAIVLAQGPGTVLLSANRSDFARVPGLTVEHWLEDKARG